MKVDCRPKQIVHTLREGKVTCRDILPLLEKIRPCIVANEDSCEYNLNAGWWRNVYQIDFKGQPVVLKSLKPKHVEPRNFLRQMRESIAQQLADETWLAPEMGHCIMPEDDEHFGYTNMFPRYEMDLEMYLRG